MHCLKTKTNDLQRKSPQKILVHERVNPTQTGAAVPRKALQFQETLNSRNCLLATLGQQLGSFRCQLLCQARDTTAEVNYDLRPLPKRTVPQDFRGLS
jgi:hypothetical protein